MKSRGFVWAGVALFTVVAGGIGAKFFLCGGGMCSKNKQALTPSQRLTLAAELVRIVREESSSSLRNWLLSQSPGVSKQAILSLDNNNDPYSRARLAALNAIYSLDSDGLSDEARKGWALVLRDLAGNVLHPGELQTDYVAKSFLIEGRHADAAKTYSLIPNYPTAKAFFGEDPELLRAPASR